MNFKDYYYNYLKGLTPKQWWGWFNRGILWHVGMQLETSRTLEAQITQKELASRIGTSQPRISHAERHGENMSIIRLRKWANALGCVVKIEVIPFKEAIRRELEKRAPKIEWAVNIMSHDTNTVYLTLPL